MPLPGILKSARIEFETARSAARAVSPELYARIALLTFVRELEDSDEAISIEELNEAYDGSRGSENGFRFPQPLAVAINKNGDGEQAIEILDTALSELPEVYAFSGGPDPIVASHYWRSQL